MNNQKCMKELCKQMWRHFDSVLEVTDQMTFCTNIIKIQKQWRTIKWNSLHVTFNERFIFRLMYQGPMFQLKVGMLD